MTTDMPQRPTSTNADEWCLYLTEVTPAAPEYIAVQIVEALEAAQAQGRREGAEEMRERGVEIAKGHKGMAAKTRRARGFKFDALEMEEILAEERGEDIASNAIARKIRNLPIPDESRRGS